MTLHSVIRVFTATMISTIALTSVSFGAQSDRLHLNLRLQQGHTYRQVVDTTTETRQGRAGSEQTSRMQIGMGVSYHVESVTPVAERMDVRMTYEWVTMHVMASDATFDFDSRTSKGAVHPMAVMFSALVGQGFGATLNADGTVANVRGLEQFHKAILDKVAPAPGPQRQALATVTAKQFGVEGIQTMIEAGFFVPDRPVAVGESWRRRMPSPPGAQADVMNAYTLRQWNAGVATVDVAADLSMRLGGGGGPVVEMKGTQTGQLTVDEATGWTKSAQFVQQVAGESGGVPLRMKTTVALTGL